MVNICKTQHGDPCLLKGKEWTVDGKTFHMCTMHYNAIKSVVDEFKCDNCDADAEYSFSYWDVNDYMESEKYCKDCFLGKHRNPEDFYMTQKEAWRERLEPLGVKYE